MPIEVQAYDKGAPVRDDIHDADVLMFRGESLSSRIIEIGTAGAYSHAAIAYRDGDRRMLVQAVGAGVGELPVSQEISTYEGAVELWRLKEPVRAKLDPPKTVHEARRWVGRPYNMTCVWRFVLDWATFRLFRHARSGARDHRAFFCSQLVARAYSVGGVDLDRLHPEAGTAPSDLVRGKQLELVHAFARVDVVARVSRPPS